MSKKDDLVNEVIANMNDEQLRDCKHTIKETVAAILNKKAQISKLELEVKTLKIQLEAAQLPEDIKL